LESLDEFRARGIWQEKKASDWIGETRCKEKKYWNNKRTDQIALVLHSGSVLV
jgi:hypothetical protein